jgi:hypothetical protein
MFSGYNVMTVIPNVFGSSELELLTSLPDVVAAQSKLSTSSMVYFQASVPESIKQTLLDTLGLDLFGVDRVPFRWIRGDTKPHVDQGVSDFDNTYLVYLTDAEGQFHIGDESYDMNAGSGFVFSEGLSHEVTGTNGTSRLLLGPMSESGFAVGFGGTSVNADGATDTVYVRQNEDLSANPLNEYKINDGEWTELLFPLNISNTNVDPASNILKVLFTTDVTLSDGNGYIQINSNGVQIGDTAVNNDGTKRTITIDGIANYNGLIVNYGNSDIYIYNLHVAAINDAYLDTDGGWIGQSGYGTNGTNNFIIGCSSDGPISDYSGGIVGGYAASLQGEGVGADLTIIGCTTSGEIGDSAGGIAGEYAGYFPASSITVIKCSSSGAIGNGAGGIFAVYAGQGEGTATATKCYSTGVIGQEGGGIFGRYAGEGGQTIAEYCYSRGTIGADAGAIFGQYAALEYGEDPIIPGSAIASNCYGIGSGAEEGIFGSNIGVGTVASNCYIADGSWSDTSAILAGLDLNTYIQTGINQPFELRAIGPSPYSLTTILADVGDEDMTLFYSQTVQAGSSTIAGVLSGYSTYSILEIDLESPLEVPTITINSTTGVISTTSSTPAGEYTIIVRAVVNPYSITTFVLTVEEGPTPPTPTPSAASVPYRGKRFDFETYNAIQQGKLYVRERLNNTNLRFKSFEDYMKYKKAYPSLQ